MKKINDRIVGGIMAAVIMAGGAAATVAIASAAPEPTVAAVTEAPALVIPSDAPNGLADEQETAAAEAEAARVAAEQAAAAEAARVAAEQAAAVEAERIAAEQAAAEAEAYEAESFEPAPEPEVVVPETGPREGTQVHTICQVLADGTQVPCL